MEIFKPSRAKPDGGFSRCSSGSPTHTPTLPPSPPCSETQTLLANTASLSFGFRIGDKFRQKRSTAVHCCNLSSKYSFIVFNFLPRGFSAWPHFQGRGCSHFVRAPRFFLQGFFSKVFLQGFFPKVFSLGFFSQGFFFKVFSPKFFSKFFSSRFCLQGFFFWFGFVERGK